MPECTTVGKPDRSIPGIAVPSVEDGQIVEWFELVEPRG